MSEDGQSWTADYTAELTGEGAPPGEYGVGSATATRINVEPMGTPVAPVEALFPDLFPPEEGTAPAGTEPVGTTPSGTQPAGTEPVGTTPIDTAAATDGLDVAPGSSAGEPLRRHPSRPAMLDEAGAAIPRVRVGWRCRTRRWPRANRDRARFAQRPPLCRRGPSLVAGTNCLGRQRPLAASIDRLTATLRLVAEDGRWRGYVRLNWHSGWVSGADGHSHLGAQRPPVVCFVCAKHRGDLPVPGGLVWEDELVVATHRILTTPKGETVREVYLGHLVVEPRRHVAELAELTDSEASAMRRRVSPSLPRPDVRAPR